MINKIGNHNILITSAGQRVSLVRAFKKELTKYFENGKVYTIDLNPIFAPACHVSDGYLKVPRVTDPNYINELIKICKDWQIAVVIPTIDTELQILSKHKNEFEEIGISIIVSSNEFVEKCRDKRLINTFFENNGIEIPIQYSRENYSFPLFIKPYDGSLSKDIFLVKSQNDWQTYFDENEKLMFMEYIDPEEHDEYTVDAYYDKNSSLKCVVPRKRLFVRAGEVNKGLTVKNNIVKTIEEKLNVIDGAFGCLTMQFFLNKVTDRIIGIEINPRFGGGYPLTYLAGGNFPKWIIQEYILGENIQYNGQWEDQLLMLRYDDEILVRNYEA
jgi:carbamoyl-phosphate synthase large subunit